MITEEALEIMEVMRKDSEGDMPRFEEFNHEQAEGLFHSALHLHVGLLSSEGLMAAYMSSAEGLLLLSTEQVLCQAFKEAFVGTLLVNDPF